MSNEIPYLEQVASEYRPPAPDLDFNPELVVMPSVDELVQRQRAKAELLITHKTPTVDRLRSVRRGGGSPIVDAAIRTIERGPLTDNQKARLRALLEA